MSGVEATGSALGDGQRQLVVDELVRGQGFMERLTALLSTETDHNHHHRHQSEPSVGDLVAKVLDSLNETISMLSCDGNSHMESSVAAMKSDDSVESCKGSSVAPKEGRGRYKRRRNGETWSEITSALVDDGHAWRKYGQKSILNSDFPRSYFRCTYKHDQGCQATKQVQQISSHPPMYKTVYQAHHTCRRHFHHPPIIFDSLSGSPGNSTTILNFDHSGENDYPRPIPGSDEARNRDGAAKKQQLTPDLVVSANPAVVSSTLDPEHGEDLTSSSLLNIDFNDVMLFDI